MLRPGFVLGLLYLGSVSCIDYNFYNHVVLDEDLDNIATMCENKLCLNKCCGMNEYVYVENDTIICSNINTTEYTDGWNGTDSDIFMNIDKIFYNLLNVPLYDNYYHDFRINKSLSDVFLLRPSKFSETNEENENITFAMEAFVGTDVGFNAYLSENGSLYLEYPNAYGRWTPVERSNFCIDIDDKMTPKFWSVLTPNGASNNEYYTIGLIVSSVFLIIVLLVYMVLPELRNLAGLVLMAYVFSLAAAFVSLACLQLGEIKPDDCVVLSGITYFFFLSSFCWMSVMSYDIWWTFRGYAKARMINRRGEHFKFGMYCIYAWGVPTIMTIGLIEIDKMDLVKFPWIVKPQVPKFGCFLEGGQKFVYLYIPMLILIILNWIFFLMTAFNIWRLVRGTAILNSAHRSQKNRLMVYLKLSVIMGINWLLEVVSYLTPELKIWMYTDAYNLLIGLSIFLIFIWKKKIYRKLKARFVDSPMVHKFYHNSMSSTLESYLSQDISSPISTNPKGGDVKEAESKKA